MAASHRNAVLHRFEQVLDRLAPAASLFAVVVSMLALMGWALHNWFLIRVIPLPGAVPMMPNTAVGLLMNGIALWLLHEEAAKPWRRRAGQVLASLAVLLGCACLTESIFGVDLGIDHLLFGETVESLAPKIRGRPPPLVSLSMCLMGLSLMLLHVRNRRGWHPSQHLVLVVALLAAQSLIRYMYLEEGLFRPDGLISDQPPFTPMAVHTTLVFLLLSLGIISIHPHHGTLCVLLRDDVGGLMTRRLLPAAILIPLVVGGVRLLGERLGLYGTTFGLSAFVLITLTTFLFVITLNANALSRLDARRQCTEQSLRFSEARLAGIVSNAAEAIISIDEELRITLFNTGAERIFGYSAHEILGHSVNLLLPERFRAFHAQHIREFVASTMNSSPKEARRPIFGRRKSGEEFQAEATLSKLEVQGKRLVTVILRDITARKRAEEKLRESEEHFRTAFEHAPIGMSLVGPDGQFLIVNGALCELVGYSQQEFLTRTFQDITHPDDLEVDLANVRRLLQGESNSYQMEKRYIHKDGHLVTILLTVSLVRDARGEPLHFISQIQDISERKQIEKAWRFLAEAGPRLADSLDPQTTLATVTRLTVPALADSCVVLLLDADNRLHLLEGLAASPEKTRVLREMITTYPYDPTRPGHVVANVLRTRQPAFFPEFPEMLLAETAENTHHLEMLRRLNPLSSIIVPLLAHGHTLGAIILSTSESERRYGAHDLALAEELARRAALAIDNARLHAQSEQATRIRDEVLRVVAHDLRTPLNVITLNTGILMRRLPAEKTADTKSLESIRKAVDRANRLIEDLLDVARMEANHLSMERRMEETAPLLKEAADLHRALAEAKSIQLTVDVPEDDPPVFANRDRVLQILSNLIGNALKFTPEGGRITLRAEPLGRMVRFSVSDTGPGIPTEDQPHLFEPFWQARAGKRDGAGLGLAIVKGLVDAHGGHLWVESNAGLGSTFFFTLSTEESAEQRPTHHA